MTRINILLLVGWLSAIDAFLTPVQITPTYASTSTSSTSTSSTSRASGVEDPEVEEEQKFKQEIRGLCTERNMPLEKVKNCRDLGSVRNSPVAQGRILRSGRLGDATEQDQKLLFGTIGITTLVDLRSPTELKDDPAVMADVFSNFTNLMWIESARVNRKDGCVRELDAGVSPVDKRRFKKNKTQGDTTLTADEEDDEFCDYGCEDPKSLPAGTFLEKKPSRKERHFVSLMNEFKYVRGTVTKLRKRDIAVSILKSPGAIVSKRVWNSLKRPFIEEINDGGLIMLNELLLRFGAPGIKYVLDLCADEERHPIAFYCTAGKDRTGMITAIILSLCGVKPEDIVEDYSLSANVYAEMNDHQAMVGALSQRNLDPKTFLGAPPQVMADTLISIRENYGSVEGYCDWIGFGVEQREKLKKALLKE
jgi:protein tyrosine/serine phosphatase